MLATINATGSCLCGGITLTVQAVNPHVDTCHCNMCRKWGGGPLFAIECDSEVSFTGEENISIFDSSGWAERGFCRHCGTHLFYRLKENRRYAIPAGLFDSEDQLVFRQQIFIDEKPAFYAFSNDTRNLTGEEVLAQHNAASD